MVREYYEREYCTGEESAGAHSMGGGGEVEFPYRKYFEFLHFKKITYLNKNKTILELGGGNGRWGLCLAPMVKKYISIDISNEASMLGQKKAQQRNISNIEFICSDITEYTWDKVVDCVYLSGVSQYIDDQSLLLLLRKIKNNLKPDGIIIDRSTISCDKQKWGKSENDYHSTYRTADEIRNIYKSVGFENVYQDRSYRFLRMGWFWNHKRIKKITMLGIKAGYPWFLWIMFVCTCFSDLVSKKEYIEEGHKWSHDFFKFEIGV